ncbi:MAG: polysaccharide deacetylase family protein [Bacilli bacterium]|nr:polysaccharide deacetylase family protein [Bacilli bacterium]
MDRRSFYFIKFNIFIIILFIVNGLFIHDILKHLNDIHVSLKGDETVVISYKTSYEDPGFEIINNKQDVDISNATYELISDVDSSKLGEYEVKYTIKYMNKDYTLIRKVEVKDTIGPTITTTVDKVERSYCDNKLSADVEYSAVDDVDGEVTESVTREDSDDKITLKVKDSSNNESILEIPIVNVEKPSNKIVLNGKSIQTIGVGGTYKEEGAYYADGCGTKIDDNIDIAGSVDTSKEGKYTITYTSKTDNKIKTTRTITVKEMPKAQTAPVTGNSVIYLTFDDGPCAYTKRILDILDKYNIKATFFVTNQIRGYQNMIGEEARRGHTVGVHTYTHQWNIYNSLDSYWNDFNNMDAIIEQQTGKKAEILRFPGGTSNRMAKVGMSNIVNSVNNKGLRYYDWNVCVEDAGACVKSSNKQQCVYNYFVNGLKPGRDNIVLLHDLKSYTADSLERMIQYALSKGYTFKAIDQNTAQVHFKPYK